MGAVIQTKPIPVKHKGDIMPSINRYINIISRCGNMYRTGHLAGTDLGPTHHAYLFAVCREPGISQETLARRIYINKSNVTRNLVTLEKNGYVERRISETDRRVTLVYPTEKAHKALPLLRNVMKTWNELLTAGFSPEELEQLGNMLARMAANATGYIDDTEHDDLF